MLNADCSLGLDRIPHCGPVAQWICRIRGRILSRGRNYQALLFLDGEGPAWVLEPR